MATEQEKYLAYLTMKGAHKRYSGEDKDYWENTIVPRIREELRVITNQDFAHYFLILQDITAFCRSKSIPLGPARGSSGGSVVAYCLGITDVEPLRFNLIFERFLNDERKAMPDIDTDVCQHRRQEVIDYIVQKYGDDHVAQIVTFGTLSIKTLIQDVGRVLAVDFNATNELKNRVPNTEKPTIKEALEQEDFRTYFDEISAQHPGFRDAMIKLEGLHRHTSVHAGGVVITAVPVTDIAPTFMPKGEGRPVIQYEMTDAETVGLLKMDLLGLKTVTHIDWAEQDVRKWYDKDFNTRNYTEEDQEAFGIINRGDTAGIFQLEGNGITAFAQSMQIDSFTDIVALLALYRPGPLESGSAQMYVNRKLGRDQVSYPHPSLEWILEDTYGIVVYQEQVMHIMQVMGGFTLGQADKMRKAMGKKKKELMDEELDKFEAGARSLGYDEPVIVEVSNLVRTFARYGFNKSHAVAYAYLTYWTAVIKARYPDCFYSAWLNVTNESDRMSHIIDIAIRSGVEMLSPDINQSQANFTIVNPGQIRFGIAAVKGMGGSFVSRTLTERDANGPFSSYYNYCSRVTIVPIDKKIALIGAGSFDFDETYHRNQLLINAKYMNGEAKKKSKDESQLDKMEEATVLSPLEMGELEKQYAGFYITADPIKRIQQELSLMGAVIGINTEALRGTPLVGGRVTNVHQLQTKKHDDMAFVTVDDGIVDHSVTVWPQMWKKLRSEVKKGSAILFQCKTGRYKEKQTLAAEAYWPIDMNKQVFDLMLNLGQDPSPSTLAQLYLLIGVEPIGDSDVYFIVDQQVGFQFYRFTLKSNFKKLAINNDLLDRLRQLIGTANVMMKVRK